MTTAEGATAPGGGVSRRRAGWLAAGAGLCLLSAPALLLAAEADPAPDPAPVASAHPDPGPAAVATDGDARSPGRFADAVRTFFSDGAYLFTFPARVTPRGAGLTAGFGAATLLALHNDDYVEEEVRSQDDPDRRRIAKRFEFLGRMPMQAGVLAILYASGRATGSAGLASTAGTSFEALLWGGVISQTGKLAMGRRQPDDASDARYFFHGSASFPSGHATRSFAVAAVMADRFGRRGAWTAYPIATLVSLAMVQRGIHWTSDIVAGAGLGLAIGKGIGARHPRRDEQASAGARDARRPSWRLQPAPGGAEVTVSF